ncbi:hypothetical protein BACCIP111883_02914 [Sutcliffiella rhizosphaerae]|uniref:Uncharacterized protein n=1 Tax=Sutcliffiella rhizosphaerae TaxID=2880967 RepID=A0ABN8AAA9_9BACI|nr:hypothetical protein BACCIP111883_02914 [Sutcliffiella rhizosphaerae]
MYIHYRKMEKLVENRFYQFFFAGGAIEEIML